MKNNQPSGELIEIGEKPRALHIGRISGTPEEFNIIQLVDGEPPDKTGFPDEHFDIIAVAETLEKQPPLGVLPCLREWRRIIKPGGQLVLLVPNMRWAAISMLRRDVGNNWPAILITLYGFQDSEDECYHTGFTLQTLRGVLENLGFRIKEATLVPWEIVAEVLGEEETLQAERIFISAVY